MAVTASDPVPSLKSLALTPLGRVVNCVSSPMKVPMGVVEDAVDVLERGVWEPIVPIWSIGVVAACAGGVGGRRSTPLAAVVAAIPPVVVTISLSTSRRLANSVD